MHFFKTFKTYLRKEEPPEEAPPGSDSYELIVADLLEQGPEEESDSFQNLVFEEI